MSEIQSILFHTSIYNAVLARKWMKVHSFYPIKRVDKTNTYLRYRITDPSKYSKFRTKQIVNGINVIIGID